MKQLARHPVRAAAAFAFIAAAPLIARAGDGPYIGIEGGANWMTPQGLRDQAGEQASLHFKSGWIGGVNFGYGTAMGFRPEIELDWRDNIIKRANDTPVSGRLIGESVFGNLWYDIKQPTGFFALVNPYFGGGVGGLRMGYRHVSMLGSDFDTVLAYQAGAGVGFNILPNLTASLDYRWIQSNRGAFYSYVMNGPIDARYRSNAAMASLRVSFGAPPPPPAAPPPPPPPPPVAEAPPPPPPPPPAPVCRPPPGFKVDANCHIIEQRVVVRAVDFEFNSATLTAPSRDTLDQVAAALQAQPELRAEVDGYTDNIGSVGYNLHLSQHRAESVRAYLMSKGIDGGRLSAHGYGKSDPIATNATADGRAQNRRVEFKISNPPPSVHVDTENASPASQAAAETEGQSSAKKPVKHHHHKKPKASPDNLPQ